jgi:hypothetical protein
MTLNTRKPTGRAGWPKILVEGSDKAGKSWSLAELSASPKVGRTVVLVLGEDEARWDEYGLIPGARFEIALHDGTWTSIMGAVESAKDEAAKARDAGEPPFVFGIDTMTAVWEGLKDWASLRARGSKKNRALLAQDPDAEIDVTSNYWNDARARHRALMRHLLTFPGIVVLIARGSEVTLFQNGQPVAGRKTWSVEGEKNLPFDVSVHVRLSRESRPLLVSASGVHCQIRPGIDPPRRLPDDWSLESVVFDTLKLDAASAEVREFTEFRQDMTPEQVRDEALKPETGFGRIKELYAFTDRNFPAVEVDGEPLLPLLKHIGDERRVAARPQHDDGPAEAARAPRDVSEPRAPEAQAPDSWLEGALKAAPEAGLEACSVLWHKSVDMVGAGELSKADGARLQAILRPRMLKLKAEQSPAPVAAALDADDPWTSAIEGMASAEDGEALLQDVADQRGRGEIEAERAALIEQAIEAAIAERFPGAETERAA